MKKTLLLLSALLMSIGTFAADIIWSEDFSSYAAGEVPSAGSNSYVCVDGKSATKIYDESLAGGTKPELLIGKNGGSFSATVPLNGKSGEMTLSFQSNKTVLTVSATGATVGTVTRTGNTYQYPVTVAAGTTSVTITFSNSNANTNARFDDLKLFQGESKKPAGLSWGTASRSVTIGSSSNTFPTLSNTNNLTVSYSSSDTNVATIAADGTITLVAAGTTTISAAFAGNDEYEAQTVSYELTVAAESTVDISNTPETAYTVAKTYELIAANEGLDTKVYVKGIITSVKEVSTQYGNATYYIADEASSTTTLYVYRGYYLGGEKFTATDQIKAGDQVIVYGKLVNYNSTYEINSGNQLYSLNGVTGISTIAADKLDASAPVYNLAGQRFSPQTNGILIQNGKKFVK